MPATPPSATFSSFDGLEISYTDQGDGYPVVAVHGYLADRSMFIETGMAQDFANAGRRIITPDLRGHGRSALPQDLESYEDRALARDIAALVDHLGLEEYDLVGYSLGGIVAATVAQLDTRIRRLVLGGIGDWIMDPDWIRPKDLARGLRGEEILDSDDPLLALLPELRKQLSEKRCMALGGVQHGHVTLLPEDAASITVPTMVIVGEGDDVNGDPEVLAKSIPNAELRVIPGDHSSAFTEPDFILSVFDFLGIGPTDR